MKVGLFFGSFNPVHVGHLMIAQYMVEYTELDEVWLVVSPQNPLKEKSNLVNVYDRLEMCKLAVGDHSKIRVSDIELKLPQPSYTTTTLSYLYERYPEHQFALIMGEDNLNSLPRWKNYEVILKDYQIYVYPRAKEVVSPLLNHGSVHRTNAAIFEISSTFIREALKARKDIQFFVPELVIEFMEAKQLYR